MQSGHRLGSYSLIEELGAGGMGVVWRAHDARLRRDVAIKILPPHLARPEALARFEREARGLAALSHPNIVSIFDLGHDGELHYIVTEILEGATLREHLSGGALPWRRATEIAATVADALAAAHAKGIVHRDLKPENIFITSDGRVKILDFGLVKEAALANSDATTQAHHTEPGVVLGTLGYMSPEQLRGEPVDYASDVFSLGCVLYELLSGRAAFMRKSTAETIAAILTHDAPPLDATTGFPPDVIRITQRCLEKNARARFQSASDLAFALRHLSMQREAAPAEPEKKRKIVYAAAAAAVLLVLALVVFTLRKTDSEVGSANRVSSSPGMSLAVVPFATPPGETYAGEGLADSLFRHLAKVHPLEVVWRKTAPRELSAAAVGAANVLRGRIERNGALTEVYAEIVSVPGGRTLWQARYTSASGDLLAMQRQLSSEVEAFVFRQMGVAAAPRTAPSTVNAEAYREYLKGRHHWNRFTVEGFETAVKHFQKSIDLDPTYALAYSGLSDAYFMLGFHAPAPEEMPKARAAAERAIDLDPQLGEGYTSLGTVLYLHYWKWREAEQALRRGVALNPRYVTAHHSLAIYLTMIGKHEEALKEITTALELDPLSLAIYIDLAWVQWSSGSRREAVESIRRAIRHDPRSALAYHELAWYFENTGNYGGAIEATATAMKLEGKPTDSLEALKEAVRSGGGEGYFRKRLEMARAAGEPRTEVATILLQLGEKEEALDELEVAVKNRETHVIYFTSSMYDSVRDHPRFQKLLRIVGFS